MNIISLRKVCGYWVFTPELSQKFVVLFGFTRKKVKVKVVYVPT